MNIINTICLIVAVTIITGIICDKTFTHEYSFVDGVYEKNALCISGVAYARNGGTLLRDVNDKPHNCVTKVLTTSQFAKENK